MACTTSASLQQHYAAGAARVSLPKRMLPSTEPMQRSNKKRYRPVSLPTGAHACHPSSRHVWTEEEKRILADAHNELGNSSRYE